MRRPMIQPHAAKAFPSEFNNSEFHFHSMRHKTLLQYAKIFIVISMLNQICHNYLKNITRRVVCISKSQKDIENTRLNQNLSKDITECKIFSTKRRYKPLESISYEP